MILALLGSILKNLWLFVLVRFLSHSWAQSLWLQLVYAWISKGKCCLEQFQVVDPQILVVVLFVPLKMKTFLYVFIRYPLAGVMSTCEAQRLSDSTNLWFYMRDLRNSCPNWFMLMDIKLADPSASRRKGNWPPKRYKFYQFELPNSLDYRSTPRPQHL